MKNNYISEENIHEADKHTDNACAVSNFKKESILKE
jgi:hypothetical protein